MTIALQYSTLSPQLWPRCMWHSNIQVNKERLIENCRGCRWTDKENERKKRRERERAIKSHTERPRGGEGGGGST